MKLSGATYFVIGLAIALIAIGYALFQSFLPNMAQAGMYTAWGEQLQTEANKQSQATKRVENAKKLVEEKSNEWQQVVATKTPPADVAQGGINLAANQYQLTIDVRKFRDSVQRAVNAQVKKGGVLVVSGPRVEDPPEEAGQVLPVYFNFPTTPYPVAIFDLGTVTVRGTWDQIQANVKAWSNMPNYLAVADGLALTGTSPNLTATYNVTVVAFARGKKVAPDIAAVTTAAAGTGLPGAAGAGAPAGIPTRPGGGGAANPAAGGNRLDRE